MQATSPAPTAPPHPESEAPAQAGARHRHANPVAVYVALAVATVIEVAITVLPGLPHAQIVPVLLALSFVKAALVALYYMHLRYEKLIYALIFATPAAFALFLVVVLLAF
jgi:cytochrome c oxidase subunit 4